MIDFGCSVAYDHWAVSGFPLIKFPCCLVICLGLALDLFCDIHVQLLAQRGPGSSVGRMEASSK